VAWVRNAVDDAIEGQVALLAEGIAADLFHARFAMGDRLNIEAATMERFGRASTPAQRAGRVLVATQVIEQSLDLDFDL
jgi:CRISPR-associated endonuclease/helicase Cas3